MITQSITAERMQTAGVPLEDARWYFTIGRPRGFRGAGDVQRARGILQKTTMVKH